jgi:phytoene dehydrogenase-like protein
LHGTPIKSKEILMAPELFQEEDPSAGEQDVPPSAAFAAKHHVVIIGAGASGLMAAHELLLKDNTRDDVRVTLVECNSEIGGRIKGVTDLVEGHVIELGAEFFHGQGTVLTDLVEKYTPRWNLDGEPLYEDIFITSYADGGPSPNAHMRWQVRNVLLWRRVVELQMMSVSIHLRGL